MSKLLTKIFLDPAVKKFIGYNQKLQNTELTTGKGLVLFDVFDFYPNVYCYSRIATILSKKLNSQVAAFYFPHSRLERMSQIFSRRILKLYQSFGAKKLLTFNKSYALAEAAQDFAHQKMSQLKTKDDVLKIAIEGMVVGKDIYNSYLSDKKATVDITDPNLEKLIADAYIIYHSCKKFFAENKVNAVISSHWTYLSHGILVRIALANKVPVFSTLTTQDIYAVQVKSDSLEYLEYDRFKETFSRFSEQQKTEFRTKARLVLQKRLSGGIDKGISYMAAKGRSGLTGYGAFSGESILRATGRPRALVLLSCFFDSPLCYRYFLFSDFWEWINFLLSKASQTNIDWYVKPHPTALPGNDDFIDILKRRYPKINFLSVKDSNRQIVAEGITAMFTTYGTAGHEFAYMGVPVVNAGDNPHIAYDFNFHPQSVAEFEKLVLSADRLKLNIKSEEVEEFFYMYYLRRNDSGQTVFHPICEIMEKQKLDVDSTQTLVEYLKKDGDADTQKLDEYYNNFFNQFFDNYSRNNYAQ